MSDQTAAVTALFGAWRAGSDEAGQELAAVVYRELRGLAARQLRRERSHHTLQPTALVHEAYLRLIDQRHVPWQGRAHFIAVAATMMRRVLIDHARKRRAGKRVDPAQVDPISETIPAPDSVDQVD